MLGAMASKRCAGDVWAAAAKRSSNAHMFVPGFDTAWTHVGNALDTPRSQDGRMVSTPAPRTITERLVLRGFVRHGSHAGGVPRWCPQPCQERAQSVPGGGETGGLQISVPQVRPRDRLDAVVRSRGTVADGPWTHFAVGPAELIGLI